MPVKKIKARINQAPWVSSEFLSLIDNREHEARLVRKNPNEENLQNSKLAKKQVQILEKSAEKVIYRDSTKSSPEWSLKTVAQDKNLLAKFKIESNPDRKYWRIYQQ